MEIQTPNKHLSGRKRLDVFKLFLPLFPMVLDLSGRYVAATLHVDETLNVEAESLLFIINI